MSRDKGEGLCSGVLTAGSLHNHGSATAGPFLIVAAYILPREIAVRILQKPLPVRPYGTLRGQRFDRPDARPEGVAIIWSGEAEVYDVRLVPANVQLERFVGSDETMGGDAATGWDQLDKLIECRRCGRVGHKAKIQRIHPSHHVFPFSAINVTAKHLDG